MVSIDDKALVGQREAALLAVEAVLVPGEALVVHHVGAMAEPCRDRRQPEQGTTLFFILCCAGHTQEKLQKSFSTVICSRVLTCDGVLAAIALLGHISLVAVHTVNVILEGGEASSCQRFTAGFAHEALRVPGLVLVADPSRGDGLRGETGTHFDHNLEHNRAGRSFTVE